MENNSDIYTSTEIGINCSLEDKNMELTACEKCKHIKREERAESDWWFYNCKCNLEPIKEFRPITGKEEIVDYKKCIDCNNGKCNNFDFDENYIANEMAVEQLRERKRKEDRQWRLEEQQKCDQAIYENSYVYKILKFLELK